jgi:predicted flap endonuclease-1-like 5' DNA nuclease
MITPTSTPFSSRRKRFSPWLFGLKVGLLAALILLWWLQDQAKQQDESVEEEEPILLPPEEGEHAQEAPQTEAGESDSLVEAPDDLTAINGIGPAYAAVLQKAGIATYAQLSDLTPDEIRDIFRSAGKRAPNTSTWPQQAAEQAS